MMHSYCKQNYFRTRPTWIVCSLLVFWNNPASGSEPVYEWQDPITNEKVMCQQCPPGKFVEQHCTKDRPTQCTECPALHYTQYWNYLERCLYCNNICSNLQVEVQPCNAMHNRVCQCKPGYYLDLSSDFCLPHATCPLGSRVARPGTPHENTKCAECPSGTFSNTSTGKCQPHTNCSEQGLELNIPGNQYHDALCTACKPNRTSGAQDGQEEGSGNLECDQALINRAVYQISSPKKLLHLKRMLEQGSLPKEEQATLLQLQAEIYAYLTSIRNTPMEASVTKSLLRVLQKTQRHRLRKLLQKRFSSNLRN
ncbi:tumor necrosis factor receptor superfamily member 6B [Eublepharis macularius]|uniref:Tumor necrosis factor receptor superfamily member 6B n=1 Tax=Eublepharis macularius TaxID=481883 RepID=A0AA97JEZ7_EUBMA|nr:tumor necrosis factor receptor superfamily member 6B [Eublepharis macularius]